MKKALFVFVCLSVFALVGCKQEEVAAPVATEEVAPVATETTTTVVATSTETVVTPEAAAVAGK